MNGLDWCMSTVAPADIQKLRQFAPAHLRAMTACHEEIVMVMSRGEPSSQALGRRFIQAAGPAGNVPNSKQLSLPEQSQPPPEPPSLLPPPPEGDHLPLDRTRKLLAMGVDGQVVSDHVQFKGVRRRPERKTNPWAHALPSNPTGTTVAPTQGDAVRGRLPQRHGQADAGAVSSPRGERYPATADQVPEPEARALRAARD